MNHLEQLNEAASRTYPEMTGQGRGIVIGGGGETFFACAWVAISELRRHGCKLPIELWHLGEFEFDPEMAAASRAMGVTVRDASDDRIEGWAIKPYSLVHSRFAEVLYLDADNIPARDPASLFRHPEYRRTGSVFWPDLRQHARLSDNAWRAAGLTPNNRRDFESGQMLVDRRRCGKALRLALHMNERHAYWWSVVYGDKSTFLLAWRKLGMEYGMPGKWPIWRDPCIVQYGFDDKPLFYHCCSGKLKLKEGRRIKAIWSNRAAAQMAIPALRRHWSGRIYDWSAMSSQERSVARQCVGRYEYARGEESRTLHLRFGGRIGRGGAACEKRWSLRHLRGEYRLIIVGEAHKNQDIAMMILSRDGSQWSGRWNYHERSWVELTNSKEGILA